MKPHPMTVAAVKAAAFGLLCELAALTLIVFLPATLATLLTGSAW